MKYLSAAKLSAGLLTWLLAFLPACSHTPVYPEIGDAMIDSSPRGAEVLIDGVSRHQMTPCRVTGIAVGARRLTLCYNNHKTLNADIVIKAGQVVRVNYTLTPAALKQLVGLGLPWGAYANGMSVDLANDDMYVSNRSNQVLRYHATDSALTGPFPIEALGPQLALAVSSRHGRLFYVCRAGGDTVLVCVDLNTGLVIRKHVQPDSSRYVKLEISPDGNVLLVADSLGRRLLVVDARLCAVVKAVPLSGYPSDVIFGEASDAACVTLCGSNRLAKVDLTSGAELQLAPTGNNPRGLFWSLDRGQLGCCNATDKQLTLVDVGNWASAIVMDPSVGGASFTAACWTDDPFYLMVLIKGRVNFPDALNIVYTRNWFTTSKMVAGDLIDVAWLPSARRYVVLARDTLRLLRGDFH